jgi:RHS repeat-associated protein
MAGNARPDTGKVVINQYSYTYNNQDLRANEAFTEPDAMVPYADELVNYTYNNVNEITQLGYDASGNLTQGYTPEGFTATYDGLNRLSSLTYTDGAGAEQRTEYTFVGNMLFRKKNFQNGVLTRESRYVYDRGLLVQERDGANNVVNEYTYGLGLPGGIGGLLHLSQGGAQYAYLYDGKGNVTALLDGVGNAVQTYQYDPFGVLRSASGAVNQPMRFSTKPYDDQTGLSYYGFRFYAPTLGRWMTRDPLGEIGGINLYGFLRVGKPRRRINSFTSLGTNLYNFASNDPINRIDPFGLTDYWKVGTGGLLYVAGGGIMVLGSGVVGAGVLELGSGTPAAIFGLATIGEGGLIIGAGYGINKFGADLFNEGWYEWEFPDWIAPDPIPLTPIDPENRGRCGYYG